MRAPKRMLGRAAFVAVVGWSLATPVASADFGDLTQKPGEVGCFAVAGSLITGCFTSATFRGASGVALSPDAKHVYAAGAGAAQDDVGAIAIFDRDPAGGALTQKPGTAGCIAQSGAGGCATAPTLNRPSSVTVSPDGRNVYAVAAGSVIAIFDRDATTGALTQKPGTAGCVSEDGSGGACADARSITPAGRIVISPDSRSAYVSSGVPMSSIGAVAVFDRDPATGALTQKAGTAGCVSEDGSGGACADGVGLARTLSVAISPDSQSVYAVSHFNGVATFDRDLASGALTQKAGAAGCITVFGDEGCALGRGMLLGHAMTVSPDGETAYLAAISALAIFDRDTATGTLTQKAGTAGCVSEDGTGDGLTEDQCDVARGLSGPIDVAASPDGASLYVASFNGGGPGGGIAVFDRDPATGALDQKPGLAGCVTETGSEGDCAQGRGLSGTAQLAIAGDGTSLYAAATGSGGVLSVFDRSTVHPPAAPQPPPPPPPPPPPLTLPPLPPPPPPAVARRPQPQCALAGSVFDGTDGDDTRSGSASSDVLFGDGGNDVLRGAASRDCLYGGTGDDRLTGGPGDDLLSGGPGADLLLDADGVDVFTGGRGNDRVDARDALPAGRRRADTVRCGAGRDLARVDRRDRVARDCERVVRRSR